MTTSKAVPLNTTPSLLMDRKIQFLQFCDGKHFTAKTTRGQWSGKVQDLPSGLKPDHLPKTQQEYEDVLKLIDLDNEYNKKFEEYGNSSGEKRSQLDKELTENTKKATEIYHNLRLTYNYSHTFAAYIRDNA
ncbi:hypothetical protein KDA08_04175 [Candidatus Saccharibacteria bacterium]|nr:hypothetical protein [Candidatus Saccharibacteria bacterium]